jgi:tetratricopeptide (TPR) repeat protein
MPTPDHLIASTSMPRTSTDRMAARLSLGLALLAACGCGGVVTNDNAVGVKLYQQGDYVSAVDHFQQALAKQPGNADCFYNLGATYHQQAKQFARPADIKTAEQYYHLCLARNPNHAACQRGLAVLLVEENRRDEAMEQLQEWASRQPDNPNPQLEMDRLCERRGGPQEAESRLHEELTTESDKPRARAATLSAARGGESRLAVMPPSEATLSPAVYSGPNPPGNASR